MTGCLRVKPGVLFTVIAPGGFRLLAALDQVALTMSRDLWITSACDGEHSGPDDPHHLGLAYDIRTQDMPLPDRQQLLQLLMDDLAMSAADTPIRTSGGLATMAFFAFIEDAGTANEHLHAQLRKGCEYP